ncbi:hypothetical protein bcgnr5372_27520 [Bacillus luti]|nr:hypothetical protein [Bacillus cereus]HDR8331139.1 hypothetical protein [Bacillus cereus]HDR8338412.1 hypothetical protein [Bacillus cereus]
MWLVSSFASDLMLDNKHFDEDELNILFLFIPVFGLFLYYVLGRLCLRRQSTERKNLLSVSSVSVVGFLIWIYCAFFSSGGWAWIPYLFYNASFFYLMNLLPTANEWWVIWIPLLPAVALWFGIKKPKTIR